MPVGGLAGDGCVDDVEVGAIPSQAEEVGAEPVFAERRAAEEVQDRWWDVLPGVRWGGAPGRGVEVGLLTVADDRLSLFAFAFALGRLALAFARWGSGSPLVARAVDSAMPFGLICAGAEGAGVHAMLRAGALHGAGAAVPVVAELVAGLIGLPSRRGIGSFAWGTGA